MINKRLIARLDIKGPNLIKGIHLEGLRVIGDPQDYAKRYYEQGADELIYIDIVASLYGRSNLTEIVKKAANDIFVPLTVGGGVRDLSDVEKLLKSGADKVAINTSAVKRPELISEVANRFGSQCMVLSIEAKKQDSGNWEVYTDCGRERSGLDVIDWVKKAVDLGAGEVLITSIDMEGTKKGFDKDLISIITKTINVPVIASGGYGKLEDLNIASNSGADGIAFADALHYNKTSIQELRQYAIDSDIPVRKI
ncbi:MAG: imidazole glycerol phosphate synthase subunit HisF [Gammaproteobacteria bacterium]|nr:imidazole glycerol phosphate synthase subunit HisF [Gammaproteobacteria bacterium]